MARDIRDPYEPPDPNPDPVPQSPPPGAAAPTLSPQEFGDALAIILGTARCTCQVIYQGPPLVRDGHTTFDVLYVADPTSNPILLRHYPGTCNPLVWAVCEAPVTQVTMLYHPHFGTGLPPNDGLVSSFRGTQEIVVAATGVSAWSGYNGTAAQGMGHQGTVQIRMTHCFSAENGTPRVPDAEVKGYGAGAGGESTYDAHPADLLVYLLTDTKNGLGLDPSYVNVDTGPNGPGNDPGSAANSYRRYCSARGWYVSRALTKREKVTDIINSLLVATDSALVLIDGKLTAIPYCDQTITRSSFTYTPKTTATVIDGAELIHDTDEPPIQVERRQESDIYGVWPVSYIDRASGYKEVVREYVDPVWTSRYGARRAEVTQIPWIMSAAHAGWVTQMLAQRAIYQRNRYRFKLGPRWSLICPTDYLSLSESLLGISNLVVRVTSVEEQEDGSFQIEAIEWPTAQYGNIDLTAQAHDGLTTGAYRPLAQPSPPPDSQAMGNLLWNARLYDSYGAITGWAVYNNSIGNEPSTITGYPTDGPDGGSYQRHAWSGTNTTTKGFYYNAAGLGFPQARTVAQMVRTGRYYVLSWYARAGSAQSFGMGLGWNYSPTEQTTLLNPNLSTSWQRYAFLLRWDGGATVDPNLFITILAAAAMTGYVEIGCAQFEEGMSPSPFATRAGEVLPSALPRDSQPPSVYDKDNLWPNPSSEIAPPYGSDTSQPEWADRYNAGAGAYGGSWVRQRTSGQTGFWVPCAEGAIFYAEAMAKRTNGSGSGGRMRVAFTATLGDLTGATYTNGAYTTGTVTNWNKVTVTSAAAPAGTTAAFIAYEAPSGDTVQFDALYARRVIAPGLVSFGSQVSSSCGSYTTTSTSYGDVTNLSVTITTTGRPVVVVLMADGSANASAFGADTTDNSATMVIAYLKLVRDSTDVLIDFVQLISPARTGGIRSAVPPPGVLIIDTVAPGTYTYKIQMRAGSAAYTITATMTYLKLAVYEL